MNRKAFTPPLRGGFTLPLRGGFTLLELLIVILIIGIIATFAMPRYEIMRERAIATEVVNGFGVLRAPFLSAIQSQTKFSGSQLPPDSADWAYAYSFLSTGPELSAREAEVWAWRLRGPYQGTQIKMKVESTGEVIWSGDHPGVPKG